MAIGERIKTFRKRKGLTQKELGVQLGFKESTADIRLAQYEAEKRVPKEDLIETLSNILEVSPEAINVPNIDTHVGVMQVLFTLEDVSQNHGNAGAREEREDRQGRKDLLGRA